MKNTLQSDPMAFVTQLTTETRAIVCEEYLQSSRSMGEVLENKPQEVRSRVLAELSLYVDVRGSGPNVELYFKKQQQQEEQAA
jgi:hypothetical protein